MKITSRCNHACVFCLEKDAERPPFPEFSTDRVRSELEELWRDGARHITFMGGETLLRKDVREILAHTRRLGFTRIGVATNGTALARPGLLADLVAHGLGFLEFSLHGHAPEVANAISGRAFTFVRQAQALAHLDALGTLPVIFNVVVCRQNAATLADIARYVRARFPRIPARFKYKFTTLDGAALQAASRGEGVRYEDVDAVALGDACEALGVPFWYHNFPLCRLGRHAWRSHEVGIAALEEVYFDRAPTGTQAYYDGGDHIAGREWPAESCGGCTMRPICPGIESLYPREVRPGQVFAPCADDPVRVLVAAFRDHAETPTPTPGQLARLGALVRERQRRLARAAGAAAAAAPGAGDSSPARAARLTVALGAPCNNGCVYCHERPDADEAAGAGSPPAVRPDPAAVRRLLVQHAGVEEVAFVGGEPTLAPGLAAYVRQCRALDVRFVSVETNGRRLSYEPFARHLVEAGVTRFVVALQGPTAELHDALTQVTGSFAQTEAGLRHLAALRHHGIRLHVTTVVTRRHLGRLAEHYAFARGLGVDLVVFRALHPTGRGARVFADLVPRHREVVAEFRALVADRREAAPSCILVDFPDCVTAALPDPYLGRAPGHHNIQAAAAPLETVASPYHVKRVECSWCARAADCRGVPAAYLARYGAEELVPVREDDDGPRARPQGARASRRRVGARR